MSTHDRTNEQRAAGSALGLSALFGVFYFIQGIAEPTEGLISQPVASLLKSWGRDASEIGLFAFLLATPWYCKPLFGLLTDFVPLAGYRRKGYLIVTSAVTAAVLIALYFIALPNNAVTLLLSLLIFPTIGVAFSDVVVDALMVDKGQPLGLTGRFQSFQWGAIWGATILTGWLGGYLSQHKLQQLGFMICGSAALVTLVLTIFAVREPRHARRRPGFGTAAGSLWQAARSPAILPVAAFLFLWNFNPFATKVLYVYMTRDAGFDEQFYGETVSISGVASMLASFAYGFYCRRVPRRWLVHLSIVAGILSTVAYWWLHDETSARWIALAVGATYATAQMVQLDLAAQCVPPHVAGTAFALLMSLSNFGTQLSTWIGGTWYENWRDAWGNDGAFNVLVGIGAAFTAGCWLLVPILNRAAPVKQSPV